LNSKLYEGKLVSLLDFGKLSIVFWLPSASFEVNQQYLYAILGMNNHQTTEKQLEEFQRKLESKFVKQRSELI
jgi:hypothetical protein